MGSDCHDYKIVQIKHLYSKGRCVSLYFFIVADIHFFQFSRRSIRIIFFGIDNWLMAVFPSSLLHDEKILQTMRLFTVLLLMDASKYCEWLLIWLNKILG